MIFNLFTFFVLVLLSAIVKTTTIGLLNVMGTEGVCSHRGRGHHQLHKIHSIQLALECFSNQYDMFASIVH